MSSRSGEIQEWQDAFVSALEAIEREQDRGLLAELRRGRGRGFGEYASRDGWVLRTLTRSGAAWDGGDRRVSICCHVASLFAQHSSSGGRGSMGTAFYRLASSSPGAEQGAERRFYQLLDSEFEDLPDRLRHAVSLLKSREIPIDWRRILADLCNWEWASRSVQKAWSRDFWAPMTQSETT